MPLENHALRFALSNEIHARPSPVLLAPARAVYVAIKQPENAAARDMAQDRAHLITLLDQYGAPHPAKDATHYYGQLGAMWLKWESHTEYFSYTLFLHGLGAKPFDAQDYDNFPHDWLEGAPGVRLTSAMVRVQPFAGEAALDADIKDWFVPESVAASNVLNEAAVIAGDFRIDAAQHMRFAVFVREGTGQARIGRIVQRLLEIETYKTLSMLGFARARQVLYSSGPIDQSLTALIKDMSDENESADIALSRLLKLSAQLEHISAQSAFRFAATDAYRVLVEEKIGVLEETRFRGRQTFREFMMRRYDPAMRTVQATQKRIAQLTSRAQSAGELLRTRVDVTRQAQNQRLLESMDRRADGQFRLQQTVEGLSVVAVSYYALNLIVYMLAPFAATIGVSKTWLAAGAAPITIILVWVLLRRLHGYMTHKK